MSDFTGPKQHRRDSQADWESNNYTLKEGEVGYNTDNGNFKIGDGATAWNSLAYFFPPGLMLPFGNTSAPSGFLSCDGSAVSRTTYAELFAAIGTTWGVGDGSTTFNVPDLSGLGVRGTGSHGSATKADGTTPYTGPAVGSVQTDQMQGHSHKYTVRDGTWATDAANILGAKNLTASSADNTIDINDPASDGTNGTPRTGDETRGAAAGVLWCIKT